MRNFKMPIDQVWDLVGDQAWAQIWFRIRTPVKECVKERGGAQIEDQFEAVTKEIQEIKKELGD